jgi:hypothetical protein
MSLSNAKIYARRTRDSRTIPDLGDSTKRTLDQLIKIVEELEARVERLEHLERQRR